MKNKNQQQSPPPQLYCWLINFHNKFMDIWSHGHFAAIDAVVAAESDTQCIYKYNGIEPNRTATTVNFK